MKIEIRNNYIVLMIEDIVSEGIKGRNGKAEVIFSYEQFSDFLNEGHRLHDELYYCMVEKWKLKGKSYVTKVPKY